MGYKTKFITWYFNEFHDNSLFSCLHDVSEASPHHREKTVAIHTDMVVTQYVGITKAHWEKNDLCGAFACAFHDTGKPAARTPKYNEERGDYFSYPGHELISARKWENFAVENYMYLKNHFDITLYDIYLIAWMIEYHLPWGIKKDYKINDLVLTLQKNKVYNSFINVLTADTWGRISDDADEKKEKVTEWNRAFLSKCLKKPTVPDLKPDQPILIMTIAPSGSGKSTFTRSDKCKKLMRDSPFDIHSWDNLRHDWYGDDYAEAYRLSCEDSSFKSKARKHFSDILAIGNNVLVDNINISKKRRRSFLTEARQKGYYLIAVVLPISLDLVLERQHTRPDKNVPGEAVCQHYMGLQLPSLGEFDKIVHINSMK